MPRKSTAASRKKFLTEIKEHLVEMKTRLFDEIESQLKAQREDNKDGAIDTFDLASEQRDREINFILSDRDRVRIKQVDDALKRIRENSYGKCDSCGLDIANGRLLAMPFARLCVDCQQDKEREPT